MSSPFAALPIELVLSILSLAAVRQPTALALSFVSSWVRTHVEPALYHTVRLRSARSLTSFISTLDGKPRGIQTALSQCTGIASLASGFSGSSYVHCVRLGGRPPGLDEQQDRCLPIAPAEQHLLALACRDGLDMSIVSPAVSRLRIQLTAAAVTSGGVARLGALRHLTHLALVYHHGLFGGGFAVVAGMLAPVIEGGRLRVLVLQVAGGAVDAHLEEIRRWSQRQAEARSSDGRADGSEGSRLIVWSSSVPRSFLSDWEEDDAFWQRAESGSMVA